jgi:hypothetical protein
MRNKPTPLVAAAVAVLCAAGALAADRPAPNPMRNAYFGAVHIHTGYSFDALTNGTITTPSNAYEWAQGKPIPASKFEPDKMMKIVTPLDFYAVADHAEFMGVFNKMADPKDPLSKTDLAKQVNSSDPNTAIQAFAGVLRDMSAGKVDPMLTDPAVSRTVWAEIVKTADAYYRPGSFTTFPAFEWTSNPNKRNLHRVVVFRDSKHVPDLVLSALDTEKPEDLWAWMQVQRKNGSTLLAIPHNGNASDGLMFSMTDSGGKPLSDAYNAERAQRTALRDRADQGHVGGYAGSFAERRVRLHRQVRHRIRRQAPPERIPGPAARPDPADSRVQLRRVRRRLGAGEHPRVDLRRDGAQGDRRHVGHPPIWYSPRAAR